MIGRKPFSVIYEDNHLLVVNKAPGILVQGDSTGDIPLVELGKQYIGKKYNKPGAVFLGVVHRIDRPVSGLVVLARTSKGLERMNALFRNKETRKTYWAIVSKKPEAENAKLTHWLVKDEMKNKTTAYSRETAGALKSDLDYQVLGQSQGNWLLQVNPETGRPHQIRVQLAAINCPIKGDLKYGYPVPNHDGSIGLHAKELGFMHPVKKEMLYLRAPLPGTPVWEPFLSFEAD